MGVPDAYAHLPTGVLQIVGLGIRHINIVMLIKEDAAGSTKLSPLGKKLAILSKQLKTVIGSVAHE
jgi:hypothetical protein